jgi:hypothetical protein
VIRHFVKAAPQTRAAFSNTSEIRPRTIVELLSPKNLLKRHKIGWQVMENEATILAIGRIERALSKLENYQPSPNNDGDIGLQNKHNLLKQETQKAIAEIDQILSKDHA